MFSVHISVVEKMDVELDRDGIVQKFEIKGEIKVTVSDPDFANLLIRMQLLENGIPLKFSVCFVIIPSNSASQVLVLTKLHGKKT